MTVAFAETGAEIEPEVSGKVRQPNQYAAAKPPTRKTAMLELIVHNSEVWNREYRALEGVEGAPVARSGAMGDTTWHFSGSVPVDCQYNNLGAHRPAREAARQ